MRWATVVALGALACTAAWAEEGKKGGFTLNKNDVGKVPTGAGPNWLAFTPDGKYLCVSNADSDDVSIIDVKTRHEVTKVKVGKVPKRIAVGTLPSRHPMR